MKSVGLAILSAATLGGSTMPSPRGIVRLGSPIAAIARSVSVPSAVRTVHVGGTTPDPVDVSAPEGSSQRYGDTEIQTRCILAKIERTLAEQGMTLSDVVVMRVFLVAPPNSPRMDYAGMMRAYRERFGTVRQPNKPARSTVQVAGLVDAGWLVEIEVTAAKASDS